MVVAVLLAVAAGDFIWPAVPLGVYIGWSAFTGSGFWSGEQDRVAGAVWLVGTLLLAAAPVVLAIVVIRPPRTVLGWIVSGSFLAITGAVIVYLVIGGFTGAWMQGWFEFLA